MRFWPFRGHAPAGPPRVEDVLVSEELLRKNLEDVLVVRERQIRGGIIAFRGDLLRSPSQAVDVLREDRKSTRLNSSHGYISYAVFCLKKKNQDTGGPARQRDRRRRG